MKIFRGKVVGVKNKKTAIVEVARFFTHPLYLKRIRKTKRYPVHNESDIKEGDIVNFAETRPISKTKRWRIVEVILGSANSQKVTRNSLTRNLVKKRVTSRRGNKLPKEAK